MQHALTSYGYHLAAEHKARVARLWAPQKQSYPQAEKNLLIHGKPSPPERSPSSTAESIATLTECHHLYDGPPLRAIMAAVCQVTSIKHVDLISPCRTRRFVNARFVYYQVARNLTPRSLPEIGRRCGGRDHTTVLNGLRRVERYPEQFSDAISAVRKALGVSE